MLIRMRKSYDVASSEITPKSAYMAMSRRKFVRGAAAAGAGIVLGAPLLAREAAAAKIEGVVKGPFSADLPPTDIKYVTTYNNFYEFGVDKDDPARHAKDFKPKPWKVTVDGAIGKPGTYDFDDLVKPHALEERIYRFRCVEAWSMVIPWVGFPLADVIKRLEPTSAARYVAFETLLDPKQMPGQRRSVLNWPYVEGLRLDEAMNPLALLSVGIYGEELPNQNGAPIRLVVPWKYGFKSIKSIVRISFVTREPRTSWNESAPNEYGFYSNVNPEVDHPRWSQATERVVDGSIFAKRKPTLKFNGYGEQVAHLYEGMDLRRLY